MRNQNSVRQVRVPIGALKPYENHPRQHNRQQRRKIRRLIENIGAQLVPVIVTPDLMIIDGLALWETMRDLGASEINVAILENQTPAEIKALRLAINRIPQDTRWHKPRLRAEIGDLIELTFDVELTGFDAAEIDFIMHLDVPGANVIEEEGAI